MSSAATLSWDEDEGIPRSKWVAFCEQHSITYSPNTVGRNVFHAGSVEIVFGEGSFLPLPVLPNGRLDFDAAEPPAYAERIRFSTFHMGEAMTEVAALAWAFWLEHGGGLAADPEIRLLLGKAVL